jgi:hypothetical protein
MHSSGAFTCSVVAASTKAQPALTLYHAGDTASGSCADPEAASASGTQGWHPTDGRTASRGELDGVMGLPEPILDASSSDARLPGAAVHALPLVQVQGTSGLVLKDSTLHGKPVHKRSTCEAPCSGGASSWPLIQHCGVLVAIQWLPQNEK